MVFRRTMTQVLTVLAVVLVLSSAAGTASAQVSVPWGACGHTTPEDKVVRVVPSPQGPLTLRCGGPLDSAEPRYGYRHIFWRHYLDFQNASFGTFQNWRDVADLAMTSLASDPDVMIPAANNQTCRSRVIFLRNVNTNQVVKQQIFTMYTQNETNNVNTLFLSRLQCTGVP